VSPICQKVVFFVEAEDAAFGDSGDFPCQRRSAVVIFSAEDGDVELVFWGGRSPLVMKFPGEFDGPSGFEVIAEGEVAEHFEEGVVAAGVAERFRGSLCFAAGAGRHFWEGGGAEVVAFFSLAEEDFLELVHCRAFGEEEGGVVSRAGGELLRTARWPRAGEEVEGKALADVVFRSTGGPLEKLGIA